VNAVLVGRIRSEESYPITRFLSRICSQLVAALEVVGDRRSRALTVVTVPVFTHIGSEFMPALREGSLFYMPTTMLGISIGTYRSCWR
jgi:Cu(I)/Ag(I) efflux system membrane protein CusA/SilA